MKLTLLSITLLILIGCDKEYLLTKVQVEKAYLVPGPKGIGFRKLIEVVVMNDTIIVNSEPIMLEQGDSIMLAVNKKDYSDAQLKKVIYRKNSEVYINLNDVGDKKFSYNTVENKPLFLGAKNYAENDSLLIHHFERALGRSFKDAGRVGIYFIIDERGDSKLIEVIGSTKDLELGVQTVVENLPTFNPALHKGRKVKVVYLLEINL
ncbi:MAG: hypothetical protein WA960_20130 [Tunicatimonas sp.]